MAHLCIVIVAIRVGPQGLVAGGLLLDGCDCEC